MSIARPSAKSLLEPPTDRYVYLKICFANSCFPVTVRHTEVARAEAYTLHDTRPLISALPMFSSCNSIDVQASRSVENKNKNLHDIHESCIIVVPLMETPPINKTVWALADGARDLYASFERP